MKRPNKVVLKNGADLVGCCEQLERNLQAAKRAVKALCEVVAKHPEDEKELPWLWLNYRVQNSIDVLDDLKKILRITGETDK
jgi:hypothetical protein